jgi:ubiquinone/menaquinone biosynthesis C-methylase UbiE
MVLGLPPKQASEELVMTDATKFQFTNPSVPKAYDEFFVPRLFEPWARLLLDEVAPREGQVLIDVATGPGTVARLASLRLGSTGRVVATDIAPPMLNIARGKPALTGAAPIEYLESPAAPLNAASSAFDLVVCQQGLQFFPDRLSALKEMHRVLKAGGRAAIAVWTTVERNEYFAAIHAALRGTVPAELADLMTAPFSWHDGAELKSMAEQAGFHEVRLLTRTLPLVFENGLEQAVQSFNATPVSPGVAALPQATQDAFFSRLKGELSSLVVNGKVIGKMVSNIIIAHA